MDWGSEHIRLVHKPPRLEPSLTRRRGSLVLVADMTFSQGVARVRWSVLWKDISPCLMWSVHVAPASTVGKSYHFNFIFFRNNPFVLPLNTLHSFTPDSPLRSSSLPFTKDLSFLFSAITYRRCLLENRVCSIHLTSLNDCYWSHLGEMHLSLLRFYSFYFGLNCIRILPLFYAFSCFWQWIIVLHTIGLKRNSLKRPLTIPPVYELES